MNTRFCPRYTDSITWN